MCYFACYDGGEGEYLQWLPCISDANIIYIISPAGNSEEETAAYGELPESMEIK